LETPNKMSVEWEAVAKGPNEENGSIELGSDDEMQGLIMNLDENNVVPLEEDCTPSFDERA